MAGHDGEFVINLRRNNLNTPWGFRLQGGKEYSTYLSIQRVFNGSPADGNLQRGDIVVAVDNEDVTQWYQTQAQDLIQSIGLTLALVVRRGGSVPYVDEKQPSIQAQSSVPSFVRQPFGQQPPQQHQQQYPQQQQQQQYPQQQQPQPLSPQMTSKTTIQFQPKPFYAPSQQPSNDLENIRPSPGGITWTPSAAPSAPVNSFSTPLQVRTAQPAPPKPYAYSPQQYGDSFSPDQPGRIQQVPAGQGPAPFHQQYGSGGRASYEPESHPRDAAVHSTQQPDSNHVTYNRDQHVGGGGGPYEAPYSEGHKGEGEEEDDYQQMTVRDIKQMFNKPDQKENRAAASRGAKATKIWTRPSAEGSVSPVANYGAPGLRPGQPSSLSPAKPSTGSVFRGPPPSDDYHQSYVPPAHPSYGQPRYASPPGVGGKPKTSGGINKLGGAYAGIVQPALPAKAPPKPVQKGQKKKDFDPNQSAVLKILQEEEERAKNQPHQREEEEEDDSQRRGAQTQKPAQAARQPQKQQQGSRLNELLERDAAQIAPYKDKSKASFEEPATAYQAQRTPRQEPRTPHQEPRAQHQEPRAQHHEQRAPYQEPRAPYQQPRAPYQDYGPSQPYRNDVRSPARGGAPPPQSGHYGSYEHAPSFPQTQYVDGIPTSDF